MRYFSDIDPQYGELVQISPLVRRIICNNPGRFTFTGTGTYVVGRGQVAIIDPGPEDDDHVAALIGALDGEEVTHIVVTHTHRDHSPATAALQTATGAPTYGFGPHPMADADAIAAATPSTWDELMPTPEELAELKKSMPKARSDDHDAQEEPGDMSFAPDVDLSHGDLIRGGTFTLQAVHTPGHISNHLCYGLPEERALFTGDHVMGWSTTIVPPPDGSMRDYMASLELLLERSDETYYPTHGPPVPRPLEFTRALIEHRKQRTAQIVDALAQGPKTIPELVTAMYADTPHVLHMAAGQSVLSHLLQLVDDGRVDVVGPIVADATFTIR